MMKKDAKIYIAGHAGLIGTTLVEKLKEEGYLNLIIRTHGQLDLMCQIEVENFFKAERPHYIFLLAAKVGGIKANIMYPAQFIYENLAIQNNVIHYACLYKVKKLLFFGSACTYPRESRQPMKEEYLLSGYLEPTNESYALAKIAGIKMCQAYNRQYGTNFICAMPTNVYGPEDNFDPLDCHVIPALIRRFHEAKINGATSVAVWGTGKAQREFIYVDDVASAALFLMQHYDKTEIVNVCTGRDVTIKELAHLIKEVVGFKGEIIFDTNKEEGIPRKVLDPSKLKALGWQAKTPLKEGLHKTYAWFLENLSEKAVGRI